MSSRGETVFVSTWGSRGSALANKVAFQRIATSNENHVFLAMRLFLHLRYKTLDLLQIHFFYSIYPYCLRAIKSFDREGWVVGVVVRASTFYNVNKSVGHYLKQANYLQSNALFVRALSSRSPRHDKVSRSSGYSRMALVAFAAESAAQLRTRFLLQNFNKLSAWRSRCCTSAINNLLLACFITAVY